MPADGTIVEGTSALDESMLTGESLPVDKERGLAGLRRHAQPARRARRARRARGRATPRSRGSRAPSRTRRASKAPIARLADRVSAVLRAGRARDRGADVRRSGSSPAPTRRPRSRACVAVLVIACPCALGLATPAAVAVGTARGAELGILFRGGDALERASRIDVVLPRQDRHADDAGTPTLVDATARRRPARSRPRVEQAQRASGRARDRRGGEGARASRCGRADVDVAPGGGLTAMRRRRARRAIGTREFARRRRDGATPMPAVDARGARRHRDRRRVRRARSRSPIRRARRRRDRSTSCARSASSR